MTRKKTNRKRWQWILTIAWEDTDRTERKATAAGTCTPHPELTRQDMFELLYGRTVRDANAKDALVVYFSLEPDDLGPTLGS